MCLSALLPFGAEKNQWKTLPNARRAPLSPDQPQTKPHCLVKDRSSSATGLKIQPLLLDKIPVV